jgi:hypothetical protein
MNVEARRDNNRPEKKTPEQHKRTIPETTKGTRQGDKTRGWARDKTGDKTRGQKKVDNTRGQIWNKSKRQEAREECLLFGKTFGDIQLIVTLE